jgi:hypothetical protein
MQVVRRLCEKHGVGDEAGLHTKGILVPSLKLLTLHFMPAHQGHAHSLKHYGRCCSSSSLCASLPAIFSYASSFIITS